MKYEYIRADGGNQTTHIFMPNVEDLMPSSDVWSEIKNEFSQAMEKELEPVKVLIQPKKKEKKGFLNKEEKGGDKKPVEEVGESVIVVSEQEQKQKSEEKMDDVNSQKEEKEGEKEVAEANTQEDDAAMEDQTLPESQDDTEQNEKEDQTKEQQETDPILELNPASLKVAELRDHLGSLGLDTKGLKKVLVERLTEYIDEKKASLADKAENAEVQAEQEKMEDDDEPVGEEEKKTDEPAEAEAKTEIEPKPEEEPEPEPEPIYELKEKSPKEKETIQKKYNLPEKPTILIQSKHNFKTASLFTLLNYGSSEVINKNYLKESVLCRIFETQMTSEICRELLQNEFAFLLLHGLQRQVEIFDQKTKQEKREKEEREAALQKAKEEKAKEEEEKKKKEAEEEKAKDDAEQENPEKAVQKKDDPEQPKETDEPEAKKAKKSDQETTEIKADSDIEILSTNVEDIELEYPKVTHDSNLLMAFGFFDTDYTGYIRKSDVEEILLFSKSNLTKSQILKITKNESVVRSNSDSVNYARLFSSIPINFVWESLVEPKRAEFLGSSNISETSSDNENAFLKTQIEADTNILKITATNDKCQSYLDELKHLQSKNQQLENNYSRLSKRSEDKQKILYAQLDNKNEEIKALQSQEVELKKMKREYLKLKEEIELEKKKREVEEELAKTAQDEKENHAEEEKTVLNDKKEENQVKNTDTGVGWF